MRGILMRGFKKFLIKTKTKMGTVGKHEPFL
jgi:hypothetical protein